MPEDRRALERAIAGAFRATIHDPITAALITSAVKRIVGNLSNAQLDELAAAAMGRRRWKGSTAEERKAHAAEMARARWQAATAEERSASGAELARGRWATMNAEERSAEMKRRAAKRDKRKGTKH